MHLWYMMHAIMSVNKNEETRMVFDDHTMIWLYEPQHLGFWK